MKALKTHIAPIARIRTNKRDTDYLRFRPYRAFTTQQPKANHWTALQRIALVVGLLALLIFSGKILLCIIT